MLEDQVAYLLQKYLGNYVKGLSKEALKISAWRGPIRFTFFFFFYLSNHCDSYEDLIIISVAFG